MAMAAAAQKADTTDMVLEVEAGDAGFALPLAAVQGVMRRPPLAPAPLTPPALMGVAMARGGVVPIVSLRGLLDQALGPEGAAARVVLLAYEGALLGLAVDKARTAPREPRGGAPMLDLAQLMARAFASSVGDGDGDGDAPSAEPCAQPTRAKGRAKTEVRMETFVSFMLDGHEYAVPAARVRGVAAADTPSPQRISLRRLLGGAALEGEEPERGGALISLGLEGGAPISAPVDAVRGLIRAPSDAIEPAPAELAAPPGGVGLRAFCHLDGGARLVGVLDLDAALAAAAPQPRPDHRFAAPLAPPLPPGALDVASMLAAAPKLRALRSAPEPEPEPRILTIALGDQRFGLRLSDVLAVRRVDRAEALALSGGRAFMYNDAVTPLWSLSQLLGLAPSDQGEPERLCVLVARHGSGPIGLVVDAVGPPRAAALTPFGGALSTLRAYLGAEPGEDGAALLTLNLPALIP